MNLVKKSNASFSGCKFELRWNMSDSCRADQWAQVAFIEIDYFECEDCEPCSPAPEKSLPDNCVNEFSVHSGWIVDAIRNDHEILWLTSLCIGKKSPPNPTNTSKNWLDFDPEWLRRRGLTFWEISCLSESWYISDTNFFSRWRVFLLLCQKVNFILKKYSSTMKINFLMKVVHPLVKDLI